MRDHKSLRLGRHLLSGESSATSAEDAYLNNTRVKTVKCVYNIKSDNKNEKQWQTVKGFITEDVAEVSVSDVCITYYLVCILPLYYLKGQRDLQARPTGS